MQANGTVTLEVTGGSGNYGYSWPSNAATQENLAAGLYSVTVTDLNSTGCQLPVLFVLTDLVAQANITVDSIFNVSCAGGADGQIFYSVVTEPGLPLPLNTVISNGVEDFNNGEFAAGTYCIVLTDANGCVAGGECFSVIEPEPLFINASTVESCGNDGAIEVNVSGGTPPYAYAWSNDAGDTDTLNDLPPGVFTVTVTDANDCQIISDIEVPDCGNCEVLGETPTVVLQTSDCTEAAFLCTELTAGLSEIYFFTDNGIPVDNIITCPDSEDNFGFELTLGSHLLVAQNTVTGCTDTLQAEVICTPTDTLDFDVFLFDEALLCFSQEDLFTEFDTLINLCPEGSFAGYEVQNDTCLLLTGNVIGTETACIILCDTIGICDTTVVNINVLDNNPADIIDTIIVTQTGTICFDTLATSLPGDFFNMIDLCPEQNGDFIDFQLNEETFCVNYEGIDLGTDLACIQVCDADNNCDTLNISLTVVPGEFFYDTLFVQAPGDTLCIDTSLLPGDEVVSMTDACAELNGSHVDFLYLEETQCVVYEPLSAGIDTSCVRLEDEFGNIVLINMVITIIETTPQFITDTIFIAESDTLCLDTTELVAGIDFVEDVCADSSTGTVDFFYNPVTDCVEYTGLDIGKDTACYVLCDSMGVCDTTYFCILVEEFFDPPIANPDADTTDRAVPIVLDVKANDVIFGGIIQTTVVVEPQYGTVIVNPDCSMTYLPDPEFCEREDAFSYEICNQNGCDIAVVTVFINCLNVRVFNVVSPNGDGINDELYIANIEGASGKLEIYNRWGNLVYRSEAYQNNWPGTFNSDKDLPDGTYYYLLEWSDEETGEVFFQRGYVELRR